MASPPPPSTPRKRKERLDAATAAADALSPNSKKVLVAKLTAKAPPDSGAGSAAAVSDSFVWAAIRTYDDAASAKKDAKAVGALDGGMWTQIKSAAADGYKTTSLKCGMCVDYVKGDTRQACSRALRIKEDQSTGKCEVSVSGQHLVITDDMRISRESGVGLPPVLILAATPFIERPAARIVEQLTSM